MKIEIQDAPPLGEGYKRWVAHWKDYLGRRHVYTGFLFKDNETPEAKLYNQKRFLEELLECLRQHPLRG